MNTRIQMLAERADVYADNHCSKVKGLAPGESWTSIRNNKFAELIVKECSGFVYNYPEKYLTRNQAREMCFSMEEHFGVDKLD